MLVCDFDAYTITYLQQVSEEVERALAKLGPAMLNGRLVALFELI